MSVTDTYGDGRHVSIDVVSNIFEGQSSVKRQRMVYKVTLSAWAAEPYWCVWHGRSSFSMAGSK